MKKLYTFLLFAAGLAGGSAYAQTNWAYVHSNDSMIVGPCINELEVMVGAGVSGESNGIITVDWGDGNIETDNYTLTPNQYDQFPFSHGYAVPGMYDATVSIYSTTAGANILTTSLDLLAGNPASCGHATIYTYRQSPGITYVDAVYDFTDANGVTTTVSSDPNLYYHMYGGLNPANAPYLVSINDAWLASNGLSQVSPDFTITGFDPSGLATPGQVGMEVTCNIASTDPDFMVLTFPWAFVAPLETGNVHLAVYNFACNNTSNAQVSLEFPAGLGLVPNTSGLLNASVSGNILTFEIPNVSYYEYVTIGFAFPGTTAPGTVLDFTATVTNINDTDPSNNSDDGQATVVNSYDPNNKLVDMPENIDPAVQEQLKYTINFQNEGNGDAYNVVITDVIDENLDLSTFEVITSKHPVSTSINQSTRMVTFTFSNIMLAPASQDEEASKGFVTYKIEEVAGLGEGDAIDNTANIYFDFNPAIVTNTTHNVNTALSLGTVAGETLSMYPNPATDAIRFNGAAVQSAKIYDLAGKLILDAASVNNNELSVAGLSNGVYQVEITTAKGLHTQKLVVRK